ncbi:MAG: M23 family metallopeptidase [Alphaproteobacteria bacterium]|nr:M23 family metallopeptidase [Alphaproteobacteria bacterium]
MDRVISLLRNSGFVGPGGGPIVFDGERIWLEDPTCFTRGIEQLATYLWTGLVVMTAFLLLGWAFSLIRSTDMKISENIKVLVIVFGIISAAPLIANTMWDGDLFGQGCAKIGVPAHEVQDIIEKANNAKLKAFNPDDLWEEYDIYDSAVSTYTPGMGIFGESDDSIPAGFSGESGGRMGIVRTEGPIRDGGAIGGGYSQTSGRGGIARRIYRAEEQLSSGDIAVFRNVAGRYGISMRSDGVGHLNASRDGGLRDHTGTDLYIGGGPPPPGTAVPSLFDGRVLYSRYSHTRNGVALYSVMIQNDNGTTSRMLYVNGNVNTGDRVQAGQIIGYTQDISRAYRNTPQHVHFELRRNGQIIDPETLLH